MPAPQIIHDLIERFERNLDAYKSGSYNETQVRREFIDLFFEALGWDVNNREGNAEAYKDVIHEDVVKVGGITKAPDYSFRIGGSRKFFVEAKKPSICIKDDPAPAFQVRRYAWSAKLPLSIVTDFDELAVYDCRIKPDQKDRADKARVKYYTFRQYAEKWDEIASIFSKNAILKGSFDKYAESHKAKRGTAEVDSAFLEEIESWRDTLARNIALRNSLSVRELNESVQRTIDRIIFLRIAEDRGIEEYGSLRGICNGPNTFARLRELFYKADDRYNSGLFHFRHEKSEAEPPDSLTISLNIDDKPLKEILKRLYYPDSPYEFAVLPADILGQVYEQFLGKVIRLTSDHRAVVEDKPEVKKAGGVFYTPTYIVEYIVKNTVGKLLDRKTPKQAESIRVLDPACGSGSFLLGAYQYLLDWHLTWYMNNDPDKWAKAKKPILHCGHGGAWHLTTAERKRILLNNIYGVDIDSQAVEVTKLSLLLKVLEGETGETLNQQMRLFHERALPDLGSNIKCGNSLIGPDFYDGRQMSLMGNEEMYRVNVFDWEREFAEVFKAGGFDAVIGNPPYLRIQGLTENYNTQLEYYSKLYKSAVKRYDLYLLFIERGYSLLSKAGLLGYICPNKFVNSDFGSGLREYLLQHKAIDRFISFGNNLVFSTASTYTGLLFLSKNNNPNFHYYEFPNICSASIKEHLDAIANEHFTEYNSVTFSDNPWVLSHSEADVVLEKITQPQTLGDVFENILVGVQSGIDIVHLVRFVSNSEDGKVTVYSEKEAAEIEIEGGLLKPLLMGEHVHRYEGELRTGYYCIYPYKLKDGKTKVLEENELKDSFPIGYAYLNRHCQFLREIRVRQKTNPTYWYSCHRSRDMNVFDQKRIITPEISLGCNMTISPAGIYHNTQVYSFLPKADRKEDLHYWLGILNSKLMWFFMKSTGTFLRGGYVRYKTEYLKPFPIRTIDFSNPTDKAHHDRMVQLVEQILDLHKQLPNAKTGHDKTHIQRQIDATDRQIDRLVYELYGLTEEEIAVVER